MTWKRDTRPENVRTFGDFTIWSEVSPDRETAHVVGFPDGVEARVLPNGTSGQYRAAGVRQAVLELVDLSERLEGAEWPLVRTYFTGKLAEAGLTWEWRIPEPDLPLVDWLVVWFERNVDSDRGGALSDRFRSDLDTDGFEIVRKGET